MKKLTVLIAIVLVCATAFAQPAKKTRRTASNTKEAVTERQISSRFNKGLRAYYTAQYDEAVQTFSGILTDAPKHAPSYYMLSRVYASQQRYSESESAIRQAVKLDKSNIWYQVALAQSCVTNENFKEALPIWEKVCREFPDNPDYLSQLALCYEKTGNAAKAEESRNRIAMLSPTEKKENPSAGTTNSGASTSGGKAKGIALLQAQDYTGALAVLEQALREDDTDYELWEAFAAAASKSGQWAKLTEKEDDLTTLFPQSSALLAALANAFLRTSQPDKAVEYYKQAKSFAFEPALIQEIKKGLYDAYTALGDTDNAARYR